MSISACSSCDSVNKLLSAANSGQIRHSAALSRPGESTKPISIPDGPVGKSELSATELSQVRDLEQAANLKLRSAEEANEAPDADDGPRCARTLQHSDATRAALTAIYADHTSPTDSAGTPGRFINVSA